MPKQLSTYNRFVRTFAKSYNGRKLMKAAAKAWKSKGDKSTALKRAQIRRRTKRFKPRKEHRRSSGNVRKTGKGKALRTLGTTGALEDLAWGWIGFNIMGKSPAALPMTRVVQGLAGIAMDRRGKGRLIYGIIDLIAIYLSGGMGVSGLGFGGGGAGARIQLAKLLPI